MKSLFNWLKTLISGRPHFYIGGQDNPYLMRWYLIPRNRWLNIYLHKFLRDDDDRALHCHPWRFASILLKGRYLEHRSRLVPLPFGSMRQDYQIDRKAPSFAYRPAETRHRVELPKDINGKPIPCWTIVITGRTSRVWGFHCPKGFVPWHEFVDQTDSGNVGRGCGE